MLGDAGLIAGADLQQQNPLPNSVGRLREEVSLPEFINGVVGRSDDEQIGASESHVEVQSGERFRVPGIGSSEPGTVGGGSKPGLAFSVLNLEFAVEFQFVVGQ